MYSPLQFKVEDSKAIVELIAQYPLAAVVRMQGGHLVADHIPLMHIADTKTHGRLIGHVARNNCIWHTTPNQEVLAVFQGPSVYISPNWYATKQEGGRVVPTWNYAVVHARCTLKAIEEPAAILDIITQLTEHQEANQPNPWRVADAPETFTEKLLDHIVGIELTIEEWNGKWKVSQNQPQQNRDSVQASLMQAGSEVQKTMARLINKYSN